MCVPQLGKTITHNSNNSQPTFLPPRHLIYYSPRLMNKLWIVQFKIYID